MCIRDSSRGTIILTCFRNEVPPEDLLQLPPSGRRGLPRGSRSESARGKPRIPRASSQDTDVGLAR
eukprot:3988769-Alexandrium_andersonii.AAC.1